MRRAARIDDNQPEIVQALQYAGCRVSSTAGMGKGFPDLLVGRAGVLYLLEVKDGSKSLSRRALTPDQELEFPKWQAVGVTVHVVCTVDEALAAVGLTKRDKQ